MSANAEKGFKMNSIQNYQISSNSNVNFKRNYLNKSKQMLKNTSSFLDKELVYHDSRDTAKFIRNMILALGLLFGLSYILPKQYQEIKIDIKEISSNLEKTNSDLQKLIDTKK